MLKIDIITLFPSSFTGPFEDSIIKRAQEQNIVQINLIDLRDFTEDAHKQVDDRPFGGGPGMVMMVEPLFKAIETLKTPESYVILTSPSGVQFNQKQAELLAGKNHIIILCGHYEGIDQRVIDTFVDAEISIGDFILTNGNLPAMMMVDAITRLLPGALGCAQSAIEESFSSGLLEYPHYTRPREFRGLTVPDILLSGDHQAIAKWRQNVSVEKTASRRPDLYCLYQQK